MSFKVADLTKNSKWKLTAEVPFYEGVMYSWGMHTISKSTYNAPVGTEFVVPVKRMSGTFNDKGWDRNTRSEIPATWEASGVYFPITLNGKQGVVFFSDLKNCIELVDQPKDVAYVLKDTVTGTYYVDSIWLVNERDNNGNYTGNYIPHTPLKKSESAVQIEDVYFKFSNTALSGKVFKNVGFAKQRLLMTVGYYNGTDNDMMKTSTPISNIPESWVLVEYDRVTKTETILDFDCNEYVQHALELKVLTTKYGSSTRSLYQKLEKKGELDNFKHFIIFTPGNVDQKSLSDIMKDRDDNPLLEEIDRFTVKEIYDGGSYTIKKSEVQMVKDIVDKKMKKVFGADSICIAIEDRHDAMQIQFTYLGNLNIKMIDMVTLQEIVQEDEVQS